VIPIGISYSAVYISNILAVLKFFHYREDLGDSAKASIMDGVALLLPQGNHLLRYRNWKRR
jgi:hypothetical protein